MPDDKKLEVMESRMLEAAKKCPQAKAALETLWPDSFKPKEPELPDLRVGDIVLCGSVDSANADTNNKMGIVTRTPFNNDVRVEFFEHIPGLVDNTWNVTPKRISLIRRLSGTWTRT